MFRPLYDGDFAKTRRARRANDGGSGPTAAIGAMTLHDAGRSTAQHFFNHAARYLGGMITPTLSSTPCSIGPHKPVQSCLAVRERVPRRHDAESPGGLDLARFSEQAGAPLLYDFTLHNFAKVLAQ